MSITSSVGLISGIDVQALVDQLISIEARPRQLVQQRNTVLQSQQVALQGISAKLLALKSAASELTLTPTFKPTLATSSNEGVLTVSSTTSAVPGSFAFTVNRLASSQQTITKGFIDTNSTPVPGGTLTFENARARLDSKTDLSELNGGDGVRRGRIKITDRSGASSIVDLGTALTAQDVIDRINADGNVNVTAAVSGDGFTLTDNTGQTTANLIVENVGGLTTATDLGLVANVAADTITGTTVNTVGENSLVNNLNDGNGVHTKSGITDFQIALEDATLISVDLDNIATIGDVIDAINDAAADAGVATLEAAINDAGTGIKLIDTSGGGGTLTVSAANGSEAASDLGILGTDDDGDGIIQGNRLRAGINSKLVRNLNGGEGAEQRALALTTSIADLFDGAGLTTSGDATDDIEITNRAGFAFQIDVDASATIQDLANDIALQTLGSVSLSIEGNALKLTDATGSTLSNFIVTDLTGSAASELGLTVNAATTEVTGVDTNPVADAGSGLGEISITDRSGANANVDLTNVSSVSEIVDLINAAGLGITASLNDAGNGLKLVDSTGGAGDIIISDVSGTTAATFNIEGTFSDTTEVDTGNLQLKFITAGTNIDGLGVERGRFIITDSNGASATVDLTQGNERTISDLLAEINSRGLAINARINDNGDGILIEDLGSGTTAIEIEDSGSTTAQSLGLAGSAAAPGADFNGSFERSITISDIEEIELTTLLSELNGGSGVTANSGEDDFRITAANGSQFDVNLDGVTDVQGVINAISAASGGAVTASITGAGTRLTLSDSTSGSSTFAVTALNESSAAEDLGILLSDDNDTGTINGSTIVETTTLEELVDLINDSKVGVTAAIINDGTAGAPYRLSLFADRPGEANAFIFDDTIGLSATTLAEAQDTVLFYGSTDPAKALAIRSSETTLEGVIPGTTISALATSDDPVQVTVTRDEQAVVDSVSNFVTKFNDVIAEIDKHDSYNAETEERGLLLGDYAVGSLRSSLFRAVIGSNSDLTSQFTALSQLGIKVGSGGTSLSFDETKFREALDTNDEAVQQLFTFKETDDDNEITSRGIGVAIDQLLKRLTDATTGPVERRVDVIGRQIAANESRIENLNELLDLKRARLEAEFLAMESALAQLQNQGSALASFQPISFQQNNNGARSLFG